MFLEKKLVSFNLGPNDRGEDEYPFSPPPSFAIFDGHYTIHCSSVVEGLSVASLRAGEGNAPKNSLVEAVKEFVCNELEDDIVLDQNIVIIQANVSVAIVEVYKGKMTDEISDYIKKRYASFVLDQLNPYVESAHLHQDHINFQRQRAKSHLNEFAKSISPNLSPVLIDDDDEGLYIQILRGNDKFHIYYNIHDFDQFELFRIEESANSMVSCDPPFSTLAELDEILARY